MASRPEGQRRARMRLALGGARADTAELVEVERVEEAAGRDHRWIIYSARICSTGRAEQRPLVQRRPKTSPRPWTNIGGTLNAPSHSTYRWLAFRVLGQRPTHPKGSTADPQLAEPFLFNPAVRSPPRRLLAPKPRAPQ
jgi:hypothetical protein